VLGVDFDPHVIDEWHQQGWSVQYGDAQDPELAASLPLGSAKWVVCATPELATNLAVLQAVREAGYHGPTAHTAHHLHDAVALERQHVNLILLPFADAASEAADRLIKFDGHRPHGLIAAAAPHATEAPSRPLA
jgi:Trk K+ transport system NAD-binding subunit